MDKTYGPLKDVSAIDVFNWAKVQPTGKHIGLCGNPDACLIAAYAERMLGITIAVCPADNDDAGDYWHVIYPLVESKCYDLPPSLNRLACSFDELGDADEEISGGDLRLQRLHL